MNKSIMTRVVVLLGIMGVASCGDRPAATKQPSELIPMSASVPAAPPGAAQEASLANGIDFKQEMYPAYLADVSGMSGRETSGRWTELAAGPAAKFHFKKPLPKKFVLEITAEGFGPNIGVPISVTVGTVKKTFVIPAPVSGKPNIIRLDFETDGLADTVEIVPPSPTSPHDLDPKNSDMRKLGIFFSSLKVVE